MKRTIFIGDVHGCLAELKALIVKLKASDSDRIILLGDLIGKGPHSREVVEFAVQNKYEAIMGNHEWYYLKQFGLKLHLARFNEVLHQWIAQLPLFIEEQAFIAVHAGIPAPGRYASLSDVPANVLVTIRNVKDNNGALTPWHQWYHGKKKVIYGHWAKQGLHITANTVGIDTGCIYGKYLSAYTLETQEVTQVKAQATYQTISKH